MITFVYLLTAYIFITIIITLISDKIDVNKKYNKLYDEYNKYIKNDKYK